MTSELKPHDIWDDATNAVCQAMQENKMCNCPDGDCLAAKIEPSGQDKKRWSSTPSADALAGLVRYHIEWCHSTKDEVYEDTDGEYVLYSEAAAVVAELSDRLKGTEEALDATIDENIELELRVEAAEAELDHIKAQEPVAILKYDRSAGNENEMPKIISCKWLADGEYPLYASPVSDILKAENERLREALKPFAVEVMDVYKDDQYPHEIPFTAGQFRAACAALSGKE